MNEYDACDQPEAYEQGDDRTQEDSLFEQVRGLEKEVARLRAQMTNEKHMMPQFSFPLNSALNIQYALSEIKKTLTALYSAADTQAPDATSEIYNAIGSINGALRDIGPYANAELQLRGREDPPPT